VGDRLFTTPSIGLHDNDDEQKPTKQLTVTPPRQHSSRPAAVHTGTETPIQWGMGGGGVDGPPQTDLAQNGPPKLASEGGPGPGGRSKGTWTLVLARLHGVVIKRSTGHTHTHTTAEQTTHTNTERATAQRRLKVPCAPK